MTKNQAENQPGEIPETYDEAAPEGHDEAPVTDTPADDRDQRLAEAEAKAQAHWEQLLRSQAELENLRRRSERELENAHKYALERFAQELLPVRDSLEMGLSAVPTTQGQAEKLREGTELTLRMLTSAMEKFGITEVHPKGASFNPEHHQAMSMQENAEVAPNTVLAVMQKGYLLNDRLIRPAMVVVAKPPAGSAGGQFDEKA